MKIGVKSVLLKTVSGSLDEHGFKYDQALSFPNVWTYLLQPMLNDQKLTLLPVQSLTDIMTTVHILEKEKDASE